MKELINEKNKEATEVVKCSRCNENTAEELHTCPYSEDVCNDNETLCNCCEKCSYNCCLDI